MVYALKRGLVVMGLMSLAACASVVDGTTQNVTVSTDPAGASCELVRDGGTIAVINPTPGTVKIGKDADDIAIACQKPGYRETSSTLSSSFTGATFGNLILGGGIGLIVDAASGANNRYPDSTNLILSPTHFPTEKSRDDHYAKLAARLNEKQERALKEIKDDCDVDLAGSEHCEEAPIAVRQETQRRLARLEGERQQAVIGENPALERQTVAGTTGSSATVTSIPGVVVPAPGATATLSAAQRTRRCEDEAARLNLTKGTFRCMKVRESTYVDVYEECRAPTYANTKKRQFSAGDEVLIREEVVGGYGIDDKKCWAAVPGTWAFAADDPNNVVIIFGVDRTVRVCQPDQNC